jgi:hypothetical protein
MVDVTQSNVPRGNVPGLKTIYGIQYANYPAVYSKFFKTESSDKQFEELMGLYGTGLLISKAEGSELSSDTIGQGFVSRLVNGAYGKVVSFTREAMINYQYSPKLQEMLGKFFADSVQQTKEILLHSVPNEGFSTVSNNTYNNPDGVALFSASHPSRKDGSVRSNLLTNAAPISQYAIEQMYLQVVQSTNDAGIRIYLTPKQVLVPITEKFNIMKIMESDKEAFTADNTMNPMSKLGLEVIASPYLTSSTAWFMTTNVDNGFTLLNREGVEMGQETEFKTNNEMFKIYLAFSFGYGDWRCCWGTPGA